MEEVTQVTNEVQNNSDSYFDGGVFQLLGWKILGGLVTVITLGICYPLAVNWLYSWEAKHTVIEGRRLKFTGSAGGLFGTWIICILLSIITLGIYAFYIPIKIKRWREANTFFEDEIPSFDAEQNLRKEKASYFDGGFWQLFGWELLGVLITFFTAGICYPWAIKMIYSWEQRHKVYCKRRCTFDGNAMQLFGTWLLCMLLSIITLGIYTWWIPIKIKKWQIKHTHLLENDMPAEEQENICLTDEEIEEKKIKAKNFKWFYFAAAVFIFLISTLSASCRLFIYHNRYNFSGYNQYAQIFAYLFVRNTAIVNIICAIGMLVLTFVHIKYAKWIKLGVLVPICISWLLPPLINSIHGNYFIFLGEFPIIRFLQLLISRPLRHFSYFGNIFYHRVNPLAFLISPAFWIKILFEIAIVMAFIGWFKTKDLDSLYKKGKK